MWGKDSGSLAAQIQKEVVDSKVPISDILRKAKILASLLKNGEFKHWVDAELTGYDNCDDLPDYRIFEPVNLGTFSGPFGKRVTNYPIPVALLPDSIRLFAERSQFMGGIKELEAAASQAAKKEGHRFSWPPEMVIIAREHLPMSDGSILVEAWKPFSKSQMEGILDQVRNRLLDFLLELQQINPDVMKSENAIRSVPSDKVQNIFNTTILGGQNIVSTGTDFSQKVTQSVKVKDAQSLLGYLRNLGLPEDALEDLKNALAQDGERPRGELGAAVKSWLGKMTVKAIDGTWRVALDAAASLLKESLFHYYGWS